MIVKESVFARNLKKAVKNELSANKLVQVKRSFRLSSKEMKKLRLDERSKVNMKVTRDRKKKEKILGKKVVECIAKNLIPQLPIANKESNVVPRHLPSTIIFGNTTATMGGRTTIRMRAILSKKYISSIWPTEEILT